MYHKTTTVADWEEKRIKRVKLSLREKEDKIIHIINEKDKKMDSCVFHRASKVRQKQMKAEQKTVPLWAWLK